MTRSKLTLAILATTLALLNGSSPMRGASFSFTPAGADIDSDHPMPDIPTTVGAKIVFTLNFDFTGLPPIKNVSWTTNWDDKELWPLPPPTGTNPLDSKAPERPVFNRLAPEEETGMDNFTTSYEFTVLRGLINDGVSDFSATLTSVLSYDGTDFVEHIGSFLPPAQQVEVQPISMPTAVPEPSTYGIVGALSILAVALSRIRTKRRNSL